MSLDTELMWGSFDLVTQDEFERRNPGARGVNLRLLELLRSHRLSATWAVVGHLFLRDDAARCRGTVDEDVPWPSTPRSRAAPSGDVITQPLWYAADLVAAIRSCDVPQEIACHSFSHTTMNRLTADELRGELRACAALARATGVGLKSFVFPHNVQAHHETLRDEGFVCFRSDPLPDGGGVLRTPQRFVRYFGQFRRHAPAALPTRHRTGLLNIPSSMFLSPRHGLRRFVPIGRVLERALSGIEQAVAERKVFHLYFHPFNLCSEPETLFWVLDRIFDRVARLRDAGALDVLTMNEIAERCDAGS